MINEIKADIKIVKISAQLTEAQYDDNTWRKSLTELFFEKKTESETEEEKNK